MANKEEKYRALVEQRRAARDAEEAVKRAKKKAKTKMAVFYSVIALLVAVSTVLLIWRPWSDATFTSSTAGDGKGSTSSDASDPWADWEFKHDMDKKHYVQMEVKDYGTIKLELDPTYAPITVDNFLCLVEEGFYDGLTFHRIDAGFMIQGGDPSHNGTGGSNVNIKGEFSANGVNNPLSHKRGVISMARSGHPDSASSQFFIVHGDSTFLDGKYASFGVVVEGMDVVDAIAAISEDEVVLPYEEQPVITKVTIVEK